MSRKFKPLSGPPGIRGKRLDITGVRFGKLIAIERDPSSPGVSYWLCRCDCGVERRVQLSNLRSGSTTSCGCATVERARAELSRLGLSARIQSGRDFRPVAGALPSRLRQRRLELGMSLQQLADATAISFAQVNRYELGTSRPRTDKLLLLATALGVAPGALLALRVGSRLKAPRLQADMTQAATAAAQDRQLERALSAEATEPAPGAAGLGARVRARRLEMQLSTQELGRRAGLDGSVIRKIESSSGWAGRTAERIAKALGCNPAELAGWLLPR